jgi:hypothetical protein
MAPQEMTLPEARTTKGHFMATTSVPKDKVQRMARILAEAEERSLNELMDDEERMLLLDRIACLKRRNAEHAAETLEAHHSGLDRLGE